MRKYLVAALLAVGMMFGTATTVLAMPSFVQQGVIPTADGVGYAYVYDAGRTRAMLASAFADPALMRRISRVPGEVLLQQMRDANPSLALPFEGTAGAARAIASDSNFGVEPCRDGMFDGTNGTTLTNKAASKFGAHQRKCYVGENVLTYKGTVLMSLMCFNVRVTWSQPRPVAVGSCPSGYKLVVAAYDYDTLPPALKAQAASLMIAAAARNSHQATNMPAYQTDDAISRKMGKDLWFHAPRSAVNFDVTVRYLSSDGKQVMQELGVIRGTAGRGAMALPNDPRSYVTESFWDGRFGSPEVSGGERRIRLFGYEWKHCTMVVTGIVGGPPQAQRPVS